MDMSGIFLILLFTFAIVYLLWYLLIADSDLTLALTELFGRSVSVYHGKTVWITGASAGLGEAMALELASVGAKLILTARNQDLLEQVKSKCIELSQGKLEKSDVLVLSFDITDHDDHANKVTEALKHFGQIDLLINNAGRFQVGPVALTDVEVYKDIFDVNFFGAIHLTKIVLNHFLQRGKGQIVVVTSALGKMSGPGAAPYGATKHALHAYYETLRAEHLNDGIDVTLACPGFFASEMASKAMGTKKGEIKDDIVRSRIEMPVARCAHLTLIAAANKLNEAWIAYQPILLMMFGFVYFPTITSRIMRSVYTRKRIEDLCKGKFPSDFPMWSPFYR